MSGCWPQVPHEQPWGRKRDLAVWERLVYLFTNTDVLIVLTPKPLCVNSSVTKLGNWRNSHHYYPQNLVPKTHLILICSPFISLQSDHFSVKFPTEILHAFLLIPFQATAIYKHKEASVNLEAPGLQASEIHASKGCGNGSKLFETECTKLNNAARCWKFCNAFCIKRTSSGTPTPDTGAIGWSNTIQKTSSSI